jgi:hypothetical protein
LLAVIGIDNTTSIIANTIQVSPWYHHNTVLTILCLPGIQGGQIGRNFAIWVIFYGIGQIFFLEKISQLFGQNFSHEKIAQN